MSISSICNFSLTAALTYTIEVAGEDQAKVIAAVSEKLPIDDIDITHVPLDEIMADMFKRE